MKNYISAENLKHKHTFLIKLLWMIPVVILFVSFVLMSNYFTVNAYNWWYVLLLPATFALIPGMMHRKEDKKLHYRAIFPLSIDLKKMWIAKIWTALAYVGLIATIHLLGVFGLQFLIGKQLTANYTFMTLIAASVVLVLTNIWQIPFCFFLAKKFGMIMSVIINATLGFAIGAVLAPKAVWIYCPYAWGMRSMIPLMHILPNGVPVKGSHALIANTSIIIPCILSVVLFIVLVGLTAHWFSKQEVK